MITKYKNQAVSAVRNILANRRAVAGIAAAAILIVALVVAFTNSSVQENVSGADSQSHSGGHHAQHNAQEHAAAVAPGSSDAEETSSASSREQTTLAAAASRPAGNGQRGDNPAAGVTGTQRRVDPDEVLGSPSNGCAIGYGEPGQCLPVYAESCEDVRQMFPQGIAVTGDDQLNLDRNNDNIACNAGD